MKRPLFYACLSYIFGIICFDRFKYWGLAIALIIFLVTVFSWKNLKKVYIYLLIFTLIYICGGVYYNYRTNADFSKVKTFDQKYVCMEGTFIDSSTKGEKNILIIKSTKINDINIPQEKVRVEYYTKNTNLGFKYGDLVKVFGTVEIPSGPRNPGGFDYKRYLLTKNIYTIIKADKVITLAKEGGDYSKFIKMCYSLKEKMLYTISVSMPKEQALLLQAIVLSKTDTLSDEVKNDFSNSGLSHIMAVSGMNVALIVLPLVFLFKRLRLHDMTAVFIISLILTVFVVLTGASASVVRAVIMSITLLFGKAVYRDTDIMTTMALSALIMLTLNPLTIFDIGFQLSYGATLGIVLLFPKLQRLLCFLPRILRDTVAVTLSAQLAVDPIIAYNFNKISLISLFSNIIAAPMAEVILVSGLVMSLLGLFGFIFIEILAGFNYILVSTLAFIAQKSCDIPLATVTVATPSVYQIIAYYLGLWAALSLFDKEDSLTKEALLKAKRKTIEDVIPRLTYINKKTVYISATSCIGMVIILNALYSSPLEISFVDVGQSDCVVIRTPKGKVMLFDCGNGGKEEFVENENTIVPFLLDKGIRKIDIIVLSHLDFDHISAFKTISQTFEVNSVIASDSVRGEKVWEDISKIADPNKTKLINFADGNIHIEKGLTLEAVSLVNLDSSNDRSLVLRLAHKNESFLFAGDISEKSEAELINRYNWQSDVLKVAHHGSKYSTTEEFLNNVNPKIAVISVGVNNFGHPSQTVIERLKQKGAMVLRTDKQGCVSILSSGNSLKVNTMNGEDLKYEL